MSNSIHHSFNTDNATKYGIEEALLIHHFEYWIDINMRADKNFHEDRYWTYQTLKDIAKHFPYLNFEKVKYAIEQLVKKGVIRKGNFNKKKFDKTVWYAFENKEKFTKLQIPHGKGKIAKPIPDTKTKDNDNDYDCDPQKGVKETDLSKKGIPLRVKGKYSVDTHEIKDLVEGVKKEIFDATCDEIYEAIDKTRDTYAKITNIVKYLAKAINNKRFDLKKKEAKKKNERKNNGSSSNTKYIFQWNDEEGKYDKVLNPDYKK